MKVSFCATIYNSRETVVPFLHYLPLDDTHEVVVTDGGSTDGTLELLREISRSNPLLKVVGRRGWTSRGRGRQLAFEESEGGVVLQLNADVQYRNLDVYISNYLSEHDGRLANYGVMGRDWIEGPTHFYIGTRKVWDLIGGYRDLYAYEDIDLRQRAASLYLPLPIDAADTTPLTIRGMHSGESDTKRYTQGFFRRAIREAISARDRIRVVGIRKGLLKPWRRGIAGVIQ